MLRRVAWRALSCSGKSAALTTVKRTLPGRRTGRAASDHCSVLRSLLSAALGFADRRSAAVVVRAVASPLRLSAAVRFADRRSAAVVVRAVASPLRLSAAVRFADRRSAAIVVRAVASPLRLSAALRFADRRSAAVVVRAVASPLRLSRCHLQPVQSRLVVGDGELQRGGAVRVARLLGFLGLFADHREGFGVVLVGTGVERLQLIAGMLLAEG